MSEAWQSDFKRVWDVGMAAWTVGRRSAGEMFGGGETPFLGSIGCTPQELFDFIDDCNRYGEPDREVSLEVAAVRRDYFLGVMEGRWSGRKASMADLPAKTDAVDGIPWLPRLISKARLKLRGEMPDDLMYGCGGDRAFLARTRLTLPSFLRLVWECGDDDRRIVEAVKASLRPD